MLWDGGSGSTFVKEPAIVGCANKSSPWENPDVSIFLTYPKYVTYPFELSAISSVATPKTASWSTVPSATNLSIKNLLPWTPVL